MNNHAGDACAPIPRRDWLRQAGLAVAAPWLTPLARAQAAPKPTAIILSYQRFGEKSDAPQTVSRATLAAHMKAIKDTGASVINMVDLVAHHAGRMANLPPRPIVLSVDETHRSIMSVLMKLLHGSAWQVSLYVTPSRVGQGKGAMGWDDISGLHHSGRFSVQSRALSGLDLVKERRSRSQEEFLKFARQEILKGKETVENRLVKPVSFQAWHAGAFDKDLMDIAQELGFHASVALGDRPASLADPMQALPRIAMTEAFSGKQLEQLIKSTYAG